MLSKYIHTIPSIVLKAIEHKSKSTTLPYRFKRNIYMVHRALKSTKKVPQIFKLGPAAEWFHISTDFYTQNRSLCLVKLNFFCKIHNWFHDFFFSLFGGVLGLCGKPQQHPKGGILYTYLRNWTSMYSEKSRTSGSDCGASRTLSGWASYGRQSSAYRR